MKRSLSFVSWCNLSGVYLTILIKILTTFLPSGWVIPLTGICTKEIIRGLALRLSGYVHALRFGGPGFHQFGSWARTWQRSSGHTEVASHMPQLEGPTTKIYSYVQGGFGEKKQEKKKKIHRLP